MTALRPHPALLLAPLLLTFLAACSHQAEQDAATARAASAPRAVTVARAERRTMTDDLALSGSLVSREEAAVSSQLSGYPVASVLVDLDAEVKRGQPLVRLDDTLLRTDIAQSRAALAQQQVAAEKADAEAKRVAGLTGSGVLSSEAIAERMLAAKTAAAAVDQARAALNAQLVRQALMTIRAPVSGRILTRAVRPGDMAAQGTVMFTIARDDLVELDAEVPEQVLMTIHPNDRATVELANGKTIAGSVRLVSAAVDAQTKLGRARIALPVSRDLRPGGFAKATLSVQRADMLAVPSSALLHDANGASLMALDRDDRVHTIPVKEGVTAGGWTALVNGPAAGTPVLTGGQGFVLDGDKVKPDYTAPIAGAAPR
jgi:HlyD family secretion protein